MFFRFVSSEDGLLLHRQWQDVANHLQEYIEKVVVEWRSVAGADYTSALTQPLLQRRHDSTIAVNFSAEVLLSNILFLVFPTPDEYLDKGTCGNHCN